MDPKITKTIYEKYGYIIYGRCLKILGSEDDAKDAMHDVFFKLLHKFDSFHDQTHIVPWIYTVSKNHCFNVLRQQKKKSSIDIELQLDTTHSMTCEDTLTLQKILGTLKKNIRDAVYYTYIEKLNQKEIHQITGQSPATIRRNLNHFKKFLPTIKKRFGIV